MKINYNSNIMVNAHATEVKEVGNVSGQLKTSSQMSSNSVESHRFTIGIDQHSLIDKSEKI